MAHHGRLLGLNAMQRINPIPNRTLWWGTRQLLKLIHGRIGGIRVQIEGGRSFDGPVIFAMNHSHYFDFMPARLALFEQLGLQTTSFAKMRVFQPRVQGAYIKQMGNIALVSRGYLISADFACAHGRSPSETEYRALRKHLNTGDALPDSPIYSHLLHQPRDLFDRPFFPQQTSYREAMTDRFHQAMQINLEQARAATQMGSHLHIYPEGQFSSRLQAGHTGAIQFALALNLPIVPVGFSGMNRLFPPKQIIPHRSGTLVLRLGEAYRINPTEFRDFRAFHPHHEARCHAALRRETDSLMERIDALLDPDCSAGPSEGDALTGVKRFFE